MGIDRKTGVHLVGAPSPAPPIVIEDPRTQEKLAFPQVAVGVISRDALAAIVTEVTRNVTQNIVNNICARLKDRCGYIKANGDPCRVARAAHHTNDHDFSEVVTGPEPGKNGART